MVTINFVLILEVVAIVLGLLILLPILFYAIALIMGFARLIMKWALEIWFEVFEWLAEKLGWKN